MAKSRKINIIIFLSLILCMVSVLSITIGSADLTVKEVVLALMKSGNEANIGIVNDIRLPRAILAIFVGASLSISGALLQAVMKNPLADPGITGVSSGASLVAIIIMLYFPNSYGLVPIGAFVGGIVTCMVIYLLSWKDGLSPMRIILAGVAINAILGGATSLISIMNSESIQGVLLWLNGSLALRGWNELKFFVPYSIIGIILSMFTCKSCNILGLGDDAATNLGTNVNKARIIISLIAVFLAAISTAAVGIIGFVGLVVPHISRMVIGSDYKFLLPMSMVLGSITLLLADTLARTIASPIELPVGIIMAVLGGPFFLYLLRRSSKNG